MSTPRSDTQPLNLGPTLYRASFSCFVVSDDFAHVYNTLYTGGVAGFDGHASWDWDYGTREWGLTGLPSGTQGGFALNAPRQPPTKGDGSQPLFGPELTYSTAIPADIGNFGAPYVYQGPDGTWYTWLRTGSRLEFGFSVNAPDSPEQIARAWIEYAPGSWTEYTGDAELPVSPTVTMTNGQLARTVLPGGDPDPVVSGLPARIETVPGMLGGFTSPGPPSSVLEVRYPLPEAPGAEIAFHRALYQPGAFSRRLEGLIPDPVVITRALQLGTSVASYSFGDPQLVEQGAAVTAALTPLA